MEYTEYLAELDKSTPRTTKSGLNGAESFAPNGADKNTKPYIPEPWTVITDPDLNLLEFDIFTDLWNICSDTEFKKNFYAAYNNAQRFQDQGLPYAWRDINRQMEIRTLGWYRIVEFITAESLIEGVRDKDGVPWSGGCYTSSRDVIYKAQKALEEKRYWTFRRCRSPYGRNSRRQRKGRNRGTVGKSALVCDRTLFLLTVNHWQWQTDGEGLGLGWVYRSLLQEAGEQQDPESYTSHVETLFGEQAYRKSVEAAWLDWIAGWKNFKQCPVAYGLSGLTHVISEDKRLSITQYVPLVHQFLNQFTVVDKDGKLWFQWH